MDSILADRVYIVTGAGRGLGRAYALAIADQGGRVVVNDLDAATAASTVDEIEERGGAAVAVVAGVDSPGTGAALVTAALSTWGRLDGIVANAGIVGVGSIFDQTPEQMSRMLEINVVGVVETVGEAARSMRERGVAGSIVLVTSGSRCGIRDMSAYGASKGAVATLCWAWALDCAEAGIRVNAISPMAATDMAASADRVDPGLPEPDAIAPIVTYLLSDASRRITGQIIRFTGDRLSLYPAPTLASESAEQETWAQTALAEFFDSAQLAAVGAGLDLSVPLDTPPQSNTF